MPLISGLDIGLITFDVAFVPDMSVQIACAYRDLPTNPLFPPRVNCHTPTFLGFGFYDSQNGK